MQKVRVEVSFRKWFGELPILTKLKKDINNAFGVITNSIGEEPGHCVILGKGVVKDNTIKIQPKIIEIMKHKAAVGSLKIKRTPRRVYVSFEAFLNPVELIGTTINGGCYGVPKKKLTVCGGRYNKKVDLAITLELLKHSISAGGFIAVLGRTYDIFPTSISYK